MSLDDVLKKLKSLQIDTVELGTGNYPGDPHCKLAMLDDAAALAEFKAKLKDHGFSISALSCHGNPLHPDTARAKHDQESQPPDHPAGREAGRPGGDRFQRLPGRFAAIPSGPTGSPARGRPTISKSSSGSGTKWWRPTGRSMPDSPPITA